MQEDPGKQDTSLQSGSGIGAPDRSSSQKDRPAAATRLPYSAEVREVLKIPTVELVLAGAGLLGCLVLTLQTLYPVKMSRDRIVLDEVELCLNIFFVAEFLTRWYSRDMKPRYLLKPAMLIDFVSFLPFILEELKIKSFPGLTFLRLLRVLRLQRFLADIKSFQELVGDQNDVTPFQLQIARALITVQP